MCLDEDELTMTIFGILIPTMVASIILYILVMRPLPYERPWHSCWNKKSFVIHTYKFVTSRNFIALKTKDFIINAASLIEVQKILYD